MCIRDRCRPTNNPSYKKWENGAQTVSFNQCQFVGSNLNKSIQDIILWLRLGTKLRINDISNFYQSIKVSVADMSLQRFLFRPDGYGGKMEFETYIICRLSYGFKHSGYLSCRAKQLTGRMFIEPDHPDVYNQLQYSLTDDIVMIGWDDEKMDRDCSILELSLIHISEPTRPY